MSFFSPAKIFLGLSLLAALPAHALYCLEVQAPRAILAVEPRLRLELSPYGESAQLFQVTAENKGLVDKLACSELGRTPLPGSLKRVTVPQVLCGAEKGERSLMVLIEMLPNGQYGATLSDRSPDRVRDLEMTCSEE